MKISPRRRARECAVQALYSWSISQNSAEEIELAFVTDAFAGEDEIEAKVDMPYFRKLFRGTVANIEAVDASIRPYLDRDENEVDPIERSVLRMSAYELQFELEVVATLQAYLLHRKRRIHGTFWDFGMKEILTREIPEGYIK